MYRTILALKGIFVFSILLCGCTEEEAMMMGVLGTGFQTAPNMTASDRALGAMMQTGSQSQLNSVNARQSSSQVNVYSSAHGEGVDNNLIARIGELERSLAEKTIYIDLLQKRISELERQIVNSHTSPQ